MQRLAWTSRRAISMAHNLSGHRRRPSKSTPSCQMDKQSFMSHVTVTPFCWIWNGCLKNDGYGVFREQPAHRAAWELFRGPIPADIQVLHHCDNPPCVNPDDLFLGTHYDNVMDRCMKQRSAHGSFLGAAISVGHAISAAERNALLLSQCRKERGIYSGKSVCAVPVNDPIRERGMRNHRDHWHVKETEALYFIARGLVEEGAHRGRPAILIPEDYQIVNTQQGHGLRAVARGGH